MMKSVPHATAIRVGRGVKFEEKPKIMIFDMYHFSFHHYDKLSKRRDANTILTGMLTSYLCITNYFDAYYLFMVVNLIKARYNCIIM